MKILIIITCFVLYFTQVVFSLTEDQMQCVANIKSDFSRQDMSFAAGTEYTPLWYAQYAFLYLRRDLGRNLDASPETYITSRHGVIYCETEDGTKYYDEILLYLANAPYAKDIGQWCSKYGGVDRNVEEILKCMEEVSAHFLGIPPAMLVETNNNEMLARFRFTYTTMSIEQINPYLDLARNYFIDLSFAIALRTINRPVARRLQTAEDYCERILPPQENDLITF